MPEPAKPDKNRVERIVDGVKNHRILSLVVLCGILLTSVSGLVVIVSQAWAVLFPPPPETPPPIAFEDAHEVAAGRTVTLDVLGNDKGKKLQVIGINPTSSGRVSIVDHKKLKYTASKSFSGTDIFSYHVRDDDGRCDSSYVSVTVTPVAPIAPHPPRTTKVEVPSQAHKLTPRHVGGDRDFNGNGPAVTVSAALAIAKDGRSLSLKIAMSARETKKDYTRFSQSIQQTIWTAPQGKKIVRLLSPTSWKHTTTMRGHRPASFRPAPGSLVTRALIVGDRKGKDRPSVTIQLAALAVLVQ